jgi:hypothetical protein
MRTAGKKEKSIKKKEDDSLYGLLSSYKSSNTYFRVLVNKIQNKIIVQITDNPKKWPGLKDENYNNYSILKRSDLNLNKFFVKYLSPVHLVDQTGQTLGMKLPEGEVIVTNLLDVDGYFSLETKYKHLEEVIQNINKLINLSPQKKYEILEKSLSQET